MKIGDIVKGYYFGPARIIRIRPFGTIYVEAANGHCYRLSGLAYPLDRDYPAPMPHPTPCSPLDAGPL